EKEKNDLAKHILDCTECQKEMNEMKTFVNSIKENKPKNILQVLNETIKEELAERTKHKVVRVIQPISFIDKIKNLFKPKFVLQGALSLGLGIFLGFLIFSKSPELFNPNKEIDLDNIPQDKINVSNISFTENSENNDEILITFRTEKPFQYKGNINDEQTKQLIATALVNSNNPGIKLKTINTIATQTDKEIILDKKIKSALIIALKTDENAGVRKQALITLTKYPYDEEIRDAFLFALSNDNNSGLRIAAINAIFDLKVEGIAVDEKIITELNKRVETDDNTFIRNRAESLLKEVN
ncbi:MAG: HEAT repeat domain-containing protein, partial [Ignavibacteriales bacterium]|nr:HEAT repeat domain-containing protein [Ignavibacteriales bacterium]